MAEWFNLTHYERVLKLATRPTKDELKKISAVAGGGIGVVGTIGFIIFHLMQFLPS